MSQSRETLSRFSSIHTKQKDVIATLGPPDDSTLQELRIECLFPADGATERDWKQNEEE
jgi:hypothetical protein